MKTIICFFLLTVLTLGGAHARLGETIEQCVQRYGEHTSIIGTPQKLEKNASAHCQFKKDNLIISVSFWEGYAVSITYRKADLQISAEDSFSENEVRDLAQLNKEQSSWRVTNVKKKFGIKRKRDSGLWLDFERADGKATGSYLGGNSVTFRKKHDGSPKQNSTNPSEL